MWIERYERIVLVCGLSREWRENVCSKFRVSVKKTYLVKLSFTAKNYSFRHMLHLDRLVCKGNI